MLEEMVPGYSKMTTSGSGDSVAVISDQNEGGSSYAGNFPLVVLGSLGGIMGGITGFVLFKGRNKIMDYSLSGADEKKPKNDIMPEEYNSAFTLENTLNEIMKRRKI